ncbi:uncharacterized protein LOC119642276 [Glossina fuscipes]|uniref:Uncharacterized protein LOC119642276 n=1 Tax=Glossina fuscipes TaxID=7396 RepID=A0A9C6DP44_9MUSC|nr:uncharacterized protein LOC119642276 [Glossina fuscipes]
MDEVILEIDFMAKHGFVLDMKRQVLQYANVTLPLTVGYDGQPEVLQVAVQREQVISQNSEAIIWATAIQELRLRRIWVIEPNKECTKDSIIIGKAVVSPVKNLIPRNAKKPNVNVRSCCSAMVTQFQRTRRTAGQVDWKTAILENKGGVVICRTIVEPNGVFSKEDMTSAQKADKDLNAILKALEKQERPTWEGFQEKVRLRRRIGLSGKAIIVEDGCLWRIWRSEDASWAKKLLVVSRVGIKDSVAAWIRNCDQCSKSKGPKNKPRGRLQQYNVGAPFERIAMDIAGPFPASNARNKYVVVVNDYFSKWSQVYSIANQEAKTIAKVFVNNWVTWFGTPIELHSDQGRNFESSIFQEVRQMFSINETRTTPLHLQSDGMFERFNRTLQEHLRKVIDNNQQDWNEQIPIFLMAYRSAVHNTTAVPSVQILLGSNLRLPADLKFGKTPNVQRIETEYIARLRVILDSMHRQIRNSTQIVTDGVNAKYDLRANADEFKEGDSLLLCNPSRNKGMAPKLRCNWEGPYIFITRIMMWSVEYGNIPEAELNSKWYTWTG